MLTNASDRRGTDRYRVAHGHPNLQRQRTDQSVWNDLGCNREISDICVQRWINSLPSVQTLKTIVRCRIAGFHAFGRWNPNVNHEIESLTDQVNLVVSNMSVRFSLEYLREL